MSDFKQRIENQINNAVLDGSEIRLMKFRKKKHDKFTAHVEVNSNYMRFLLRTLYSQNLFCDEEKFKGLPTTKESSGLIDIIDKHGDTVETFYLTKKGYVKIWHAIGEL